MCRPRPHHLPLGSPDPKEHPLYVGAASLTGNLRYTLIMLKQLGYSLKTDKHQFNLTYSFTRSTDNQVLMARLKCHELSKNFMNKCYDFRRSGSLFRLQRQDGEGNSGTLWRSPRMAIDRNEPGALPDAALLLLYHQVKKRQSK